MKFDYKTYWIRNGKSRFLCFLIFILETGKGKSDGLKPIGSDGTNGMRKKKTVKK